MNGLGYASWPDRLFVRRKTNPKARSFWVEFKRVKEDPTPLQQEMIDDLKDRGEHVYVVRTEEEFRQIFNYHN